MKLSLDWLREYVDLPADLDPHQLAHDLTMSTVEVEAVEDLAAQLAGVVISEVRTCTPHPDADKLNVCTMHDGRTVVCGGSNVAAGMKVALALPGAVVGGRDGKPLTIAEAAVRGVASSGMICSAGELGLADLFPSTGKEIMDLGSLDAPVGTLLSTAIGYDDIVLDIDNKSLTNRPDLWGHLGMARELAALYELPLKASPAPVLPTADGGFEVRIEDPRCRRYTATRIEGVDGSAASPLWLAARLAKVGQRPISLVVDLTNYVMMAVGQPSHAFDARDLPERVEVRAARAGEALTLLDGTELTLDPQSLVIASHAAPTALAGVMGGALAVRDDTDALWLEIASFDHVDVRRTARRFGLRTESSTRFEKGIDTPRVETALGLFQALFAQLVPGSRVVAHVDNHPQPTPPVSVSVSVSFLHGRLGRELGAAAMVGLLGRLGFCTDQDGDALEVHVPSWRATGDVDLPEDIVEEVGRLYGFEALGFSPPQVALVNPVIQPVRRMERRLREYLAFRCGLREVVTYPWVSERLLQAAGYGDTPTLGLAHPPSPDMRLAPSLVPQMLGIIANNLRFTQDFGVFEVNRVFHTTVQSGPEGLPVQPKRLSAAVVGADAAALFYRLKGAIEGIAGGVQVAEVTCTPDPDDVPTWADPKAVVGITCGGQLIGHLAVLSARAKRLAGIKRGEAAILELSVEALEPHASRENRYAPLPQFPQVDFDISFVVDQAVPFRALREGALQVDPLILSVAFVDEYVGAQVADGKKSVTLRLRLGAAERTLVRAEIDAAAGAVIEQLTASFGGSLRA
jgi:phenylalanyl-tRNA synthetase beta chain